MGLQHRQMQFEDLHSLSDTALSAVTCRVLRVPRPLGAVDLHHALGHDRNTRLLTEAVDLIRQTRLSAANDVLWLRCWGKPGHAGLVGCEAVSSSRC